MNTTVSSSLHGMCWVFVRSWRARSVIKRQCAAYRSCAQIHPYKTTLLPKGGKLGLLIWIPEQDPFPVDTKGHCGLSWSFASPGCECLYLFISGVLGPSQC